MKDSGNKELQDRLSGIRKRGEKKIDKYVSNKFIRGMLFAEGAVLAGALMRELYDSLHPGEIAPGPVHSGGGENPNPTIPELPPDTHIYKDIGDVDFSSRGGIQTVIDMKHKLLEAYHDEIASGQTDKIPPAYLKVIEGDPTELAKEFDWYRPDQLNESVNMFKGSTIHFDHGEVDSHSIYNIHHEPETESLLEKDGSLGADTEKGFGPEDNERYFHYENGDDSSNGYIIKEEDIQPSGKPGGIIEEEDIQPLQTHGTNHIDYEKQNPDDLLKPASGNKAPSIKTQNIKVPGPNGPINPEIQNPGVRPGQFYYGNPNPPRIMSPGVRLWGSNFSPSDKKLLGFVSILI
jgi:hypothetical protein